MAIEMSFSGQMALDIYRDLYDNATLVIHAD